MPSTEAELRDWRWGNVIAERLAAGILAVEGYEDIDPQAPLGGPDGGKDILCSKAGRKYVAACYFANSQKTFAEVKAKFASDTQSAKKHSPYALVFITNQGLTLGQRSELEKLAVENGLLSVVYHLERLRFLLDSPLGYGLRLQFLQIAMSDADQIAFFETAGNRTALVLDQHKREMQQISKKLDLLLSRSDGVAVATRRIAEIVGASVDGIDEVELHVLPPVTEIAGPPLSATLTIPMVLAFHRLAGVRFPQQILGRLRTVQVWVGVAGGSPDEAFLKPPPWDQVQGLLAALLASWNDGFAQMVTGSEEAKYGAVAKFHQTFLSIHPFVDGNGTAARALLEQQCMDIFGAADLTLFEQGGDYVKALQQADGGDYEPLATLISDMISGSVFEAAFSDSK